MGSLMRSSLTSELSRVSEERGTETSDIFQKEDIQWPQEAFTILESDIAAPYLPKTEMQYTLVLDLDETLVHCS